MHFKAIQLIINHNYLEYKKIFNVNKKSLEYKRIWINCRSIGSKLCNNRLIKNRLPISLGIIL